MEKDSPAAVTDGAQHQGETASSEVGPAFFISYTQVDRPWAEWIAWQLESEGYSVLIQAWDFVAGGNFVLQMDRAAAESARTIAVLSEDYLASEFGKAEWAAAFAKDPTGERKKLLPIRVADVAVPGLLQQRVHTSLFDCDERTAKLRLLGAAKGSRLKPSSSPIFPATTSATQEKPIFPSALPSVWNLPPRNRNFTGREEWLDRLQTELTADQRTVVTQTVIGLGGIGKSQLAIEFAYRNAKKYRLVWWVRSETHEARSEDLSALARRLGLSGSDPSRVDSTIEQLGSWLEQNPGWLLIFDNAESPEDVRDLLPKAGSGHVLLTSRYMAWGALANVLNLGLWTPEEAVEYLLARTGQPDANAAAALAEALGYLPLAIEQAAAYIDETQLGIAKYTELYRKVGWKLLEKTGTKAAVATIWKVSLQAVGEQSSAAVALLQLAAFLPPDNFPRRRLHYPEATISHPLAEVLREDLGLNMAISVLRRYSLIQATPESISVHRLVQVVVQEALSSSEREFFPVVAHRLQYGAGEGLFDGLSVPPVQTLERDSLSGRIDATIESDTPAGQVATAVNDTTVRPYKRRHWSALPISVVVLLASTIPLLEWIWERTKPVETYIPPSPEPPAATAKPFAQQWHLHSVEIEGKQIAQHASVVAAWEVTRGEGTTIAVIDDGFDLKHREFDVVGKIVAPRDVAMKNDDPKPHSNDRQGTAVMGIAAAAGLSAAGVAPRARVMPIRSVSGLGSQEEADAFVWATEQGADVILAAWGPADGDWSDPKDPLHQEVHPLPESSRLAIDYAIRKGRGGKGTVIVWSAGNGNESVDNDGYASYEKVITVGASNANGFRSIYSDYGSAIWCVFPSNDFTRPKVPGIWTTDISGSGGYNWGSIQYGDPEGDYTNSSGGTSAAAAGVAGVAALILSANPNLYWNEVKDILRLSADRIDEEDGEYDQEGHSRYYGYGRVNALRAVELAKTYASSPP